MKQNISFRAIAENVAPKLGKKDLFSPQQTIANLTSSDKTEYILSKYTVDSYRKENPLSLKSKCFCDFSHHNYPLSSESNFLVYKGKGLLCATSCVSQPKEIHFIDMLNLCDKLPVDCLVALNLFGSGASIPQHTHFQFLRNRNIYDLFHRNIRCAKRTNLQIKNNSIVLQEILSPIWGIKLILDSQAYSVEEMGRLIHQILNPLIQKSQLRLSYNFLLSSEEPNVFFIFFRHIECPFSSLSIFNLIEEITNLPTAKTICFHSPNTLWRWGYLEACLGFLPLRDNTFTNTKKFPVTFWEKLYQCIAIPLPFREVILHFIETSLVQTSLKFSETY